MTEAEFARMMRQNPELQADGHESRKPVAAPASRSEHDEQCELMRLVAEHVGEYPELELLFAIPNGGQRSKAVAGKLKMEGVRAGIPDLFLPVARHDEHGLWIELKVGNNRPTPVQQEWINQLWAQRYRVEVCYSAGSALTVLLEYLTEEK